MDTLQWLNKLISYNTISNNPNMELIEAIALWFKEHNLDTQIIHGATKTKGNLLATIPTKTGQTQGGIVLSGHTDVVPVAGQIWTTDPFVATEIDGKIYGRGTSDMKGFIAVLLALVPEFNRLELNKPIHFAFTYDEEVGCIGVDFLIEYLQEKGINPEGCIVGEPTSMRPIIGEKSRQVFHCQIQGLSAHSSRADRGCNAIEYASRLICYINKLADYTREKGPFDKDYDLPFTTISTNIVSGGTATNVIPGNCELLFEVRYLPQFPLENFRSQIENYINTELLPDMKKIYPEAAIYLDQISEASGFAASEDAPLTRLVRTITGVKERYKVSYSTEARTYQDAGIPSIICGPGNIEQAHRPNEFISIDQLKICEHMLKNVVNLFCLDIAS
ncbi:acetylornithine deacetylase [Legionella hackeliae]|uniref:Acetylornithine deacetylase n=1 Tax=Legionella hackeliae TaxID=449 RepID=A0A0A8UX25_LEGHA|nr:acetylornithine deacetylase [Legionella hackeliae]KTD12660.1 acetylornithine deacetylase [Legionella hackeliae]CEK12076.1 Acetylornithine deacetylase [Legionella hackeliae]STX48864.1 Acetylornithine deacetylase [Legionella hackeliae]